MIRQLGCATAVLLGGLVAWAEDAVACEPLPCQSSHALPTGGNVPENGSLSFFYSANAAAPPRLTIERLDGGARVTTARTESAWSNGWRLLSARPTTAWKSGERYRATLTSPCTYVGPATIVVDFTVGPAAPLPTALGNLHAKVGTRGTLRVGTASGSCSVEAEASYVDVEVDLDPSALPWRDVLAYETFVDGKPWHPSDSIVVAPPPGSSWLGHGRDRIYVLCEKGGHGFPGVTQGTHLVELRASVSGADIATPPVRIAISCSGASGPLPAPSSPFVSRTARVAPGPSVEITAEKNALSNRCATIRSSASKPPRPLLSPS